MSASFVSAQAGWVLGDAPCGSSDCTTLLRTRDGGQTWTNVAAPPYRIHVGYSIGVHVRFADLNNGWVFGPELWTTHDGGNHWQRSVLPGVDPNTAVSALEAASGSVHAAVLDTNSVAVRVETSLISAEGWQVSPTTVEIGAGPIPGAQIALQGTRGWLIENDRGVVGGAQLQGGRWLPWHPPCPQQNTGGNVAASTPANVVVICQEGVFGGPIGQFFAYVSSDAGATFHRRSTPVPGGFVASATPSTIVVGGSDPSSGRAELEASFDGGATWRKVYQQAQLGQQWFEVGATTTLQGFAISNETTEGQPSTGSLVMTHDGGHHWLGVTFQSATT